MKTTLAIAACATLLCACHALVGTAANAVLNTAVGTGAAMASRASGGCYASCPVGTTCNSKTGYCEELPCHGQCMDGERCDTTGLIPHCVRDTPDLQIHGPDGPAAGVTAKPTP